MAKFELPQPINGGDPKTPFHSSGIFRSRGSKVKWPTLRKAYLDAQTIPRVKKLAGLIFLEGEYETNMNQWHTRNTKDDRTEYAVFFEARKSVFRDVRGRTWPIFLLSWIGNFHNGSIFHCAWQYPHCRLYPDHILEFGAFRLYRKVVEAVYPEGIKDDEVRRFVNQKWSTEMTEEKRHLEDQKALLL